MGTPYQYHNRFCTPAFREIITVEQPTQPQYHYICRKVKCNQVNGNSLIKATTVLNARRVLPSSAKMHHLCTSPEHCRSQKFRLNKALRKLLTLLIFSVQTLTQMTTIKSKYGSLIRFLKTGTHQKAGYSKTSPIFQYLLLSYLNQFCPLHSIPIFDDEFLFYVALRVPAIFNLVPHFILPNAPSHTRWGILG